MEAFAAECMQDILDQELDAVAHCLLSPVGDDIKEENLTSLVFDEMIATMNDVAPHLWRLLRSMAYTSEQERRNSAKSPDKVSSVKPEPWCAC